MAAVPVVHPPEPVGDIFIPWDAATDGTVDYYTLFESADSGVTKTQVYQGPNTWALLHTRTPGAVLQYTVVVTYKTVSDPSVPVSVTIATVPA